MPFQSEPGVIRWKVCFSAPIEQVYDTLDSDAGRARFWAESAVERDGAIAFDILNYPPYSGRILGRVPPHRFALDYFGTRVEFTLTKDRDGGTELALLATEVDDTVRAEMTAGWVSVLMAMKAAVDHGVDLRNHDARRSWQQGYVDN